VRRRPWARRAGGVLAAVLVVLVPLASACSQESTTVEAAEDPADQPVPGPAPTAPPVVGGETSAGTGGDVDVNELIRRIDELNDETDLCTLLTGQALRDVTQSNVNLTSLLTNPSGFTQLFASLDRLFGHLVQIGPPELSEPLRTMQGVWTRLSEVDPRAIDAEARAGALIADPAVQAAQTAIGDYVTTTCAPTG
jgi:hypothetical protein